MSDVIIGIDLGTTNSSVAAIKNGKIEIFQDPNGKRLIPSYIAFTEDEILVGRQAKDKPTILIGNSVYDFKRLIGQNFDDPKVQKDIASFPYTIFDDGGSPKIRVTYKKEIKELYPEQLSAFILEHLRGMAERRLGKKVRKAVITVPVYFNDAQRHATIDAGKIAGFEQVNIINEPTAAALAYTYVNRNQSFGYILIYDFGGGTFDVSIVTYKKGICIVKATDGDTHLGGRDLDEELARYISNKHQGLFINTDYLEYAEIFRRLKEKSEICKKKLSTATTAAFELTHITKGRDIATGFTRATFKRLIREKVQKTIEIVERCLKEANIKKSEIQDVVLVGGSSRIPLVKKMLKDYFGEQKLNEKLNPDEAVVFGAAVYAASISGNKDIIKDITSLSIGTAIPRNTPIPFENNQAAITFQIYQGEKRKATSNHKLGEFSHPMMSSGTSKTTVETIFKINEMKADVRNEIQIDTKANLKEEQIVNKTQDFISYQHDNRVTPFARTREQFALLQKQQFCNETLPAPTKQISDVIIGIDLGTTNSCVAAMINGTIVIIHDQEGKRLIPSYVKFEEKEILIGRRAKKALPILIENAVYEFKRLIGQNFDNPKVQKDIANFPYTVFDDRGSPKIRVTYKKKIKELYPEELSAFILEHLRCIAETRLGEKVNKAVITIPAYFNDAQRRATIDAGKIAGFEQVNIINEPTAAALAYTHENKNQSSGYILIYDFGGGTFDVSIVTYKNGICIVKATDGDTHLGGKDLDEELTNHMRTKHQELFDNIDDMKHVVILRRLKHKSEICKKRLSFSTQAIFELSNIINTEDIDTVVYRSTLEGLIRETVQKTIEIVERCLKEAKIQKSEINEVVLIGGSSRIPLVRGMLTDYFGRKELSEKLNPDEAVAFAAAVYAASISAKKDIIKDITSLSIGTNIKGDVMSIAIPRNTPIPCEIRKRYKPVDDNQTAIGFLIYQGENQKASLNHKLGEFWHPVASSDARKTVVETIYNIDEEGILKITVSEVKGDVKTEIKFDTNTNLTEEQIASKKEDFISYQHDNRVKHFAKTKEQFEQFHVELMSKIEKLPYDARVCMTDLCVESLDWSDSLNIDDVYELPAKMRWLQRKFDELQLEK